MKSWARVMVRAPWVVVAVWIALVVGGWAAVSATGTAFSNDFGVKDSDSDAAMQLLQRSFPQNAGDSDTLVWRALATSARGPSQ